MNRITVSILAAAVASLAMPAAAQHYGGPRSPAHAAPHRGGAPMAARVQTLERNVAYAHRAGAMSTGKAREFRRDIDNLVRLEARYRAEGRLYSERSALERRYNTLDRAIDRYVRDAQRRHGGRR